MENEASQEQKRSWFERLSDLLIREPKDREQLIMVLRDAEERDILSPEMLTMLESTLRVSEMQVREVMLPKSQMITISKESTLAEFMPIVIESGHSRFPVVDTATDEVVGILLAKDLLKIKKEQEIIDLLRPAVFVPESKRLDVLLREFRISRNHMAIVIDEYGHISGLVTIEDVLEEIVGEIEDEYDVDEKDNIKPHHDGSYIVKASTSIEDFNKYFHVKLSDEEFDTIGGLILKALGHLPKRGEVLTLNHFHFKVLHSDKRRVYLLEVKKSLT